VTQLALAGLGLGVPVGVHLHNTRNTAVAWLEERLGRRLHGLVHRAGS